jgi:hypothetical protein
MASPRARSQPNSVRQIWRDLGLDICSNSGCIRYICSVNLNGEAQAARFCGYRSYRLC